MTREEAKSRLWQVLSRWGAELTPSTINDISDAIEAFADAVAEEEEKGRYKVRYRDKNDAGWDSQAIYTNKADAKERYDSAVKCWDWVQVWE